MIVLQADYEMLSALDEGTSRCRPISEMQLASLPTHLHIANQKVLSFLLPPLKSLGLRQVALPSACACKQSCGKARRRDDTLCREFRMHLRRNARAAFAWTHSRTKRLSRHSPACTSSTPAAFRSG